MKVFEVIRQVAEAMSKVGISKDNQNQQQKYKFRGIDDVYNALAPILADKGLVILPRCAERTLVERQTKNGGNLFYVTVKAEFDFVAAEDGSMHTVATYGEAMDSADKATNKAMSAAYKYACFQAFCIPTEGDNDADSTTHEVEPRNPTTKKPENKGSSQQSGSTGSDKQAALKACERFATPDVHAFIEAHAGGKAKQISDLSMPAEWAWLIGKANNGELEKWISDQIPF